MAAVYSYGLHSYGTAAAAAVMAAVVFEARHDLRDGDRPLI